MWKITGAPPEIWAPLWVPPSHLFCDSDLTLSSLGTARVYRLGRVDEGGRYFRGYESSILYGECRLSSLAALELPMFLEVSSSAVLSLEPNKHTGSIVI